MSENIEEIHAAENVSQTEPVAQVQTPAEFQPAAPPQIEPPPAAEKPAVAEAPSQPQKEDSKPAPVAQAEPAPQKIDPAVEFGDDVVVDVHVAVRCKEGTIVEIKSRFPLTFALDPRLLMTSKTRFSAVLNSLLVEPLQMKFYDFMDKKVTAQEARAKAAVEDPRQRGPSASPSHSSMGGQTAAGPKNEYPVNNPYSI
jgi:hypothetical protein